jgi:hypothetical protein
MRLTMKEKQAPAGSRVPRYRLHTLAYGLEFPEYRVS